jgi:hypothetical protein
MIISSNNMMGILGIMEDVHGNILGLYSNNHGGTTNTNGRIMITNTVNGIILLGIQIVSQVVV